MWLEPEMVLVFLVGIVIVGWVELCKDGVSLTTCYEDAGFRSEETEDFGEWTLLNATAINSVNKGKQ